MIFTHNNNIQHTTRTNLPPAKFDLYFLYAIDTPMGEKNTIYNICTWPFWDGTLGRLMKCGGLREAAILADHCRPVNCKCQIPVKPRELDGSSIEPAFL